MIDITGIVVSLLVVLGTVITIYLIPYIKERYTKEQLNKACSWARIAVNAAEQLTKSGVINPEERKDYVMQFLESKGIKLNLDEVSVIVESFVNELPELIIDDKEVE